MIDSICADVLFLLTDKTLKIGTNDRQHLFLLISIALKIGTADSLCAENILKIGTTDRQPLC